MILDAHQHYWLLDRGDYGWLEQAPAILQRDFLPADIRGERISAGVSQCVLIQAAPSEAETRYLFGLARADEHVAGVVGWVDFEADDVAARIAALVRDGNGLLVGLRPMAQDMADPQWLARPSLDAAFDAMQQHDLAFDALVVPAQLRALDTRLAREPLLRVVLDHAGKPDIANGRFHEWARQIDRLAGDGRLHCKLSGLLTQLEAKLPDNAIDDYVGHLFARFGAERLLWGSDWPVVTLRGDYGHWLALAQTYTRALAPAFEEHVFGGNARRFYRLDRTSQPDPATHGQSA
ncbi:amidohydrolase family protein [Rhodanobacter koreensis]